MVVALEKERIAARQQSKKVTAAVQREIQSTREQKRKLSRLRELGQSTSAAEAKLDARIVELEELGREASRTAEREAQEAERAQQPVLEDPRAKAEAIYKAQKEFEKGKQQLDTGEWIETGFYKSLTDDQKKALNSMGIKAFNKEMLVEIGKDSEGKPQYMYKDDYEGMSDENRTLLDEIGLDKFQEVTEGHQSILNPYQGYDLGNILQDLMTGEGGVAKMNQLREILHKLGYNDKEIQQLSNKWQDGKLIGEDRYVYISTPPEGDDDPLKALLNEYLGYDAAAVLVATLSGTLTPSQQKQLTDALLFVGYDPKGLQGISQFVQANVRLDAGDWVNREFVEQLPKPLRDKLNEMGLNSFSKYAEQLTQQLAQVDADVESIVASELGYGDSPTKRQQEDIAQAIVVLDTFREEEELSKAEANKLLKQAEMTEGWSSAERRELTDAILEAQKGNPQALNKLLADAEWYEAKEKASDSLDNAVLLAVASLYESAPEAYPQYKDAAEFVADNVLLDAGDWIGKDTYLAMPEEDQVRLNELGVEGYQEWFDKEYIKLSSGQYIGKADFEEMPEEHQKKLTELGSLDKYNKWFNKNYIQIGESYIDKESWDAMTPEDQNTLKQLGIAGYADWFMAHHIEIGDGGYMVKTDFEKMTKETQAQLKEHGYKVLDNIHVLTPKGKWVKTTGLTPGLHQKKLIDLGVIWDFAKFEHGVDKAPEGYKWVENVDTGIVKDNLTLSESGQWVSASSTPTEQRYWTLQPDIKEVSSAEYAAMTPEERLGAVPKLNLWEAMTPWKEEEGKAASPEGVVTMVAELAIPFVYASAHWGMLSSDEKKFVLALDLLSLVPFAMVGTRAAIGSIRLGQSAARAFATSVGRMALAEIKAPYTVLRHPLATGKIYMRGFQEFFGGHAVPYEVISRGLKGSWGSDIKLGVGLGTEVKGATLEAMGEIMKASTIGTRAEALVGTKLVRFSPTGFERIAGRQVCTHSTPQMESFMESLGNAGFIEIKGEGAGLHASIGGTEFWKQSAHGKMGQIPGGLHIEAPIKDIPISVALLRDPKKIESWILREAKAGLHKGEVMVGNKIYRNTAEAEVIALQKTKLYPVKGPTKTFRWKEPDPALLKESQDLMKRAAALDKGLPKIKSVAEYNQVRKQIDELTKESLSVYKQALKKGKPRSITLDVDFLESFDIFSGEKLIFLHTATKEGLKTAKPWTKLQIAQWKAKGYANIPRDAFIAPLRLPKMSPEEQIARVLRRMKATGSKGIAEAKRWEEGFNIIAMLGEQDVPPSWFRKFDLGDVANIPKSSVNELTKWIKAHPNHRVYGSMVERVQAKGGLCNDLDIAFNNPVKVAEELAEVIRKTSKVKVKVRPAMQGGLGSVVEIQRGGKWITAIDVRSMIEHSAMLPYGLKPQPSVVVNGIKMESLGEHLYRRGASLLFPGFGPQGRRTFGPAAAGKWDRLKDIDKFLNAAETLMKAAKLKVGKLAGKISDFPLEWRATRLAQIEATEAKIGHFASAAKAQDGEIFMRQLAKVEDDIFKGKIKELPFAERFRLPPGVAPAFLERVAAGAYVPKVIRNIYEALSSLRVEQLKGKRILPRVPQPRKGISPVRKEEILREAEIARTRAVPRSRVKATPRLRTPGIARITTPATTRVPARLEAPRRLHPLIRVERIVPTPYKDIPPAPRVPPRRGAPAVPAAPPPVFGIPPGFLPEDRDKAFTEEERKGSVAWRQGLWYILIYPPYGEKEIIYSKKPFPGIKMTKGAGSAYRSIGQPKQGTLPPLIQRDMGVVDVHIRTPKKGKDKGRKPTIRFTPDPKQETTLTTVRGK